MTAAIRACFGAATLLVTMLTLVVIASCSGPGAGGMTGLVMADGAALYTLSNQQPSSLMQYNCLHDYQTSQWADYGDNGIYMDEQTSGYTVAHNAMINAPTNVAQNQIGQNTITDNPASNAPAVTSMAGIEASYADIKNTTIPTARY